MKKIITITFLIIFFNTFSQNISFIDTLLLKFNQYKTKLVQEKIYLTTDRPNYIAGESIWFNIFLTNYGDNKLLNFSKIAYIELIDGQQNVMLQTKIKLENGFGKGKFILPNNINSGNYTIRAYTHWMKNFDNKFYFQKEIEIFNTFKNSGNITLKDSTSLSLDLCSEHTADSIKIYFKIYKNKKPYYTNGFLTNYNNDTIVRFKSNNHGLGYFYLKSNQDYSKYIISVINQKTIKPYSFINQINYNNLISITTLDSINLKLNTKNDKKSGKKYLFCHSKNNILLLKTIQQDEEFISIHCPISTVKNNVIHISLLNENKELISQKSCFIKSNNTSNIEIKSNKIEYNKREKVILKIKNNSKIESVQSISVFAIDSLNKNYLQNSIKESSILSDFPELCLTPNMTVEDINTGLNFEKWSKFSWNEILNKLSYNIKYLPEYATPVLSAIVKDSATGRLAENVECFLSFPSKSPKIYLSKSNSDGIVFFEINNIEGIQDAVLQTYSPSGRKYFIEPQSPFSEDLPHKTIITDFVKTTDGHSLKTRMIDMQINSIFTNPKNYPISDADSLMFFGKPDELHKLDDYTRFKTLKEVITEFVPGMAVKKRKGKQYFTILDRKNKGMSADRPLVMLDGVPIFEADSLLNFNPLKIKSLQLITNKFYFGSSVFGGIANFKTYDGDLGGFQVQKNWTVFDYDGFQPTVDFYSPDYSSDSDFKSRKPDFRNLLYWNPSIKLKNNQEQNITFFTSDKVSKYKIVLQGLDMDGNIVYETSQLEVK